jgi:molecular chaperone Hsp33
MMGLMLKGDGDKLTVKIGCDGPVQEILATAYPSGAVKGYIAHPSVDLPLRESDGKLDVGRAVGTGNLTVIKDLGLKEPYVGRVDLVSGEIAEDFTNYFAASEQQPSSVALGVLIAPDRSVAAAGGLIIQVLPDALDECLDRLETQLRYLPPVTELISQAGNVCEFMDLIFLGMPDAYMPVVLEERNIFWQCDCSRERMEKALISIGRKDLRQLIEEDHGAELTCHFCRKQYQFSEDDLQKLFEEASHE